MRRTKLIVFFLAVCLSVKAQTIDTQFDVLSGIQESKTGGVRVIKPYSEGYLLGGHFNGFQGQTYTSLVKVDASGLLDEKFRVNFDLTLVNDIAIMPDNSIIVVGEFQKVNDQEHLGIVKLAPDGTVDDKFNAQGLTKGGVLRTVEIDDKGEAIYVGGEFEEFNGEAWNNLVKLTAGGETDQSFNPGGTKEGTGVYDIHYMAGAGRLMVVGEFTLYNDEEINNIVRVFEDGSVDDSFKPSTWEKGGRINAVDISSKDNAVLVGGNFEDINGERRTDLALLDVDGNLVNEFDPKEIEGNEVYDVEYPDSGPIIIVGDFATVTSLSRNNIALINPNSGEAVAAIGPGSGTDQPAYAIGQGVNSGILIGGDYNYYDCRESFGVSKIVQESAGEPSITMAAIDVETLCTGDSFSVRFLASGAFCNNTFMVQLSNPSGDFSNATTLGSEKVDVERGKDYDGTITAVIPTSVTSGTGYQVRVVGTSPGAISNQTTKGIQISQSVGSVGLISGPNAPCTGTTASYFVAPVSGATSYNWAVPPGWSILSGNGTNNITVGVGAGSGLVRVVPVGDCGNGASRTKTVTVTSPPPTTIGNISGARTLCVGINTDYVIDGNGGTYNWTVPAGVTILSGQNTSGITVRASAVAEDGEITVTQVNTCGSSNPSRLDVAIFEMESPGPIVVSNSEPCGNEVITLTVNNVGVTTYNWQEFDGLTITNETETSLSFRTNGNSGTITYGFAFGQCATGGTITSESITTTPNPGGMGTLSIPATICENETGVVMGVPPVTDATGYQWSLPSDAIITSGDDTESITVNVGATEGLINVVAYNECGTGGSQEASLNLNTVPSSLGPITGSTEVCESGGASYYVEGGGRINSYVWSLPVGATFASSPNSPSVEVNFASNGGTVSVAAQNVCGVGPSSSLPVAIDRLPNPGEIVGETTPCEGSTGLLYALPPISDAISYTWQVSRELALTGQSGNRAQISVGDEAGQIRVTVTDECGSGVSLLNITPDPLPDPAGAIKGDERMCPGESGVSYFINPVENAKDYLWAVPAGASIVSGEGTTSISVDFADTDGLITVTPQNECGAGSSSEITVAFDPLPQGQPLMSGETGPCAGGVYTYTIEPVMFATGYSWSYPADATLISGGGTSANIRLGDQSGAISVTPTNSCGTGNTSSVTVTVDTPPVIGTIAGPTTVCEGTTNTYSVSLVADATSYRWSIPADAELTTGANSNTVSVTFGQESGNVSVEVTDACGTVSETLPIAVDLLPGGAGAISGPTEVCEFEQGVNYSILPVANATSYNWTVPSGAGISNDGSNSVIIDFNEGDGLISVVPTNNCGNGRARSIAVAYNTLEETQPIVGAENTCSYTTETYTVPVVPGAIYYNWAVPQDAYIVSGEGTNTVEISIGFSDGVISVTPESECGPGSTSFLNISVEDVIVDAGGFFTICGNTITANANLNNGETGVWSVVLGSGDFSDVNDPNATITNVAEGVNEYRWEVTNGTCTGSSSMFVDATYPVTPTATISVGANPVCSGELTSFSSSVQHSGGSPVYVWRKNGIGVGSNSPSYTDAALVNSDQISLEVSSSETCVTSSLATSNTITMAVNTTVTPTVVIEADKNPICEGEVLSWTVIDSTGGGAIPSFQWFKNGSPVGTDNYLLTDASPTDGDEYSVTMTSSSACASVSTANSTTEIATVQPAPAVGNADFYEVCSGDGVVNLTGSFSNSDGVLWTSDGEGTFSDPTSPNPTYTLAGFDFFGSTLSLTMQTTGNGVCSPAYAYNSLMVTPSPEVNVGEDITICEDQESVKLSADVQFEDSFIWTTSGTGTFVPAVANATSPTYFPSPSDIANGTVTLTVIAEKAGCGPVSESMVLSILPNPNINAGTDQQVCGNTTTLNAFPTEAGETGSWQLYSGNANFDNVNDPLTSVASLQLGDNVLIWEVTNGQCVSTDTITINRGTVTVAQVGRNRSVCSDTVYVSGNLPQGAEVTQWQTYTGGASLNPVSSTAALATNLDINSSNLFIYSITRGVCTSRDTLTITQITPTLADAGNDIEVCASGATLVGNTVQAGETVSWTLNSGGGLLNAPTASLSTVEFLGAGENSFIYAVTRGGCTTYDTVLVVNNEVSLPAIQTTNICGDQSTLSGTELDPSVGESGMWTILEGAADFEDATSGFSNVENLAEGTNTFQWEVTKGSCSDATTQTIEVEYITTPTVVVMVGANPVCGGETVSFSSVVNEGGSSPTYRWKLNGTDVGNNSSTYTSSSLVDGDQVSLEVTSSKNCVTTSVVTSNVIDMVVTTSVVPNTAISFSNDSICEGESVKFTVIDSTGGGNNPTFEWFRDGEILFGINENEITIADIADNEEVFVRMTSSSTCASKTYDSSSVAVTRVFTVPNLPVFENQTICADTLTLNAFPLEAGQTGLWTLVNGAGMIQSPTLPKTTVQGLATGGNEFAWTLGYEGVANCSSSQNVIYELITATAQTGSDQVVIENTTTLNAVDPAPYTGEWSRHIGGGNIDAPSALTTVVTELDEGINQFVWLVNTGTACVFSDTITVNYIPGAPFVDAGPDQSICVNSTVMAANVPEQGETGTWSIHSGTVTIADINDPETTVTDIASGKNVLVWSVDNGVTLSDTVIISYQVPIVAVEDEYTVLAGESINIDVLINDTTSGGDQLTLTIIQEPEFGEVLISLDGTSIEFVSQDPTIIGNDTVIYRVTNQCGAFDEGRVVVQTLNTGPQLPVLRIETIKGNSEIVKYAIALLDVNQNIDVSSFAIVSKPSGLIAEPQIFAQDDSLYIALDLSEDLDFTTEEDSIVYEVCDVFGLCAQSKVLLKVTAKAVTFEPPAPTPLNIYEGVSPNEDGKNDLWKIQYLDDAYTTPSGQTVFQYTDNEISVFNRWGDRVFYLKGSVDPEVWDGTKDGTALPDGTYYYVIDADGDGKSDYTGHILLKK